MPPTVYPLSKSLSYSDLLERLERYGKNLNAIRCYNTPDAAKKLHVLVKDNIGLTGFTTTAGSYALKDLALPDAFCVQQLKKKGMDVFGKTNLLELAGFLNTTTPYLGFSYMGGYGVNPHGKNFPCGSSSSGSAIAVAAGLCDAALGTETRGSLMIPGLYNGVFSMKPTRGLISKSGIFPLSHTFDTPGVMARSVDTLKYVLEASSGFDPEDSVTAISPSISLDETPFENTPVKIALLTLPEEKPFSECEAIIESFKKKAAKAGVFIVPFEDSTIDFDYELIVSHDFIEDVTAFLTRYATGTTPKNFAEFFEFYKSNPAYRPNGMDRLGNAAKRVFPAPDAFEQLVKSNLSKARERIESILTQTGCDLLMTFPFRNLWAISGAPSIAIPLALKDNGEPLGFILGGREGDDAKLLATARRIEKENLWLRVDSY